jgi:pectate lyase
MRGSFAAAVIFVLACAAAPAEERVVEVKVRADSEHPGNEAFRAMDGNPGSIWHSQWKPPAAVTPLPHDIVADLGGAYEISGFTYAPRPNSRNGRIKDYEAYLSDAGASSLPLAGEPGEPIVKGTFSNPNGENVVKFAAPVKGRYFRLRALSNVTGQSSWAGIGDLQLHCEGVKFVGKPWSLKVDFPEAGADVIALIEGFPLLERLLELDNPWGRDPTALKEQLFPGGIKSLDGSEAKRGVFVDRRVAHSWREISYAVAAEREPVDNPGLRMWDYHAYETDYYALDSARPLIRMHLGRPLLNYVDRMKVLFPKLARTARSDIPARMDRIVEALKPYGAKKLPKDYKSYPYILPGGTRMTITDYTVDGWSGRYGDSASDDVRIKVDLEPAAVPAGREQMPQLVPWRAADVGRVAVSAGAMTLGHLQPLGRAAPAGESATAGEDSPRQWPDTADGFAGVDALGQNGTTGGAGGKVVTVTTQEELEKYAQAKGPYIIRVAGEIKVAEKQNPRTRYEKLTTKEIHVASDKTIIGVGKSGHIVGGGFFLGPGTHNVILRNLTIRDTFVPGDWAGLSNDFDGLQMDDAHHVWVDHCHFSRHGDGCLDSRAGTTYLTVSWCIFSDHNKTFGVGWDTKVTAQITLHHSWFRNMGCRSPGAGQVLRAHYYNNYLQNISVCSHRALIGTNLIVQNSHFDNVTAPQRQTDATVTMIVTGSIYKNTRADHATCGRVFFDPSRFYPYTLDKAEDIPGLLAKYAGPQENIGQ